MNRQIPLIIGVAALLATSCAGFFDAVVTVTEVRDSAMKELAQLHKQGLLTPEQDFKIASADLAYRKAALVTERALVAYQNGGDRAEFVAAMTALKAAAGEILAILNPLNADATQKLETKLTKASKP
jgi:hypothetical protein